MRTAHRAFVIALVFLALSQTSASAAEVAHWRFDANLDDSVGSNDGTFQGVAGPDWTEGYEGIARTAITLPGNRDHVQVPDPSSIPVSTGTRFSVSCWLRGDPASGRTLYFENEGVDLPSFELSTSARTLNGRILATLRDARGVVLVSSFSTTAAVLDGEWHHLAFVNDAGTVQFWVDGELDNSLEYRESPNPAVDSDTVIIGAGRGCCYWAGSIDEMRAFDHALTESEIAAMVPAVCPEARIATVSPTVVSTEGGTEITITGGFSTEHVPYLGGRPLTNLQYVPSTDPVSTIIGTSPALERGAHTLEVRCDEEVADTADQSIVAALPTAPDIDVSITSANFGTVEIGDFVVETVTIRNNGDADLNLFQVVLESGQGEIALLNPPADGTQLEPSAEAVFDVRFTPSTVGVIQNVLRVRSTDPDEPLIQITLEGIGRAAPVLDPDVELSISMTDFGNVDVGSFATADVTIRNTGDANLTLLQVVLEGGEGTFALNNPPPAGTQLAPAASSNFVARFTPPAEGEFQNVFRLRSNDPDEPLIQVTLEGVGIALPTPRIRAVEPSLADTRGGERLVISGSDFSESMQLVQRNSAETQLNFELISSTEVHATTPPTSAGLVSMGVRLEGQELDLLADALEYIDPAAMAPQSVETSVVDEVVQIDWTNFETFENIDIYRDGVFIDRIPGSSTSFIDPELLTQNSALYTLVGRDGRGGSGSVNIEIAQWLCEPVASYGGSIFGKKVYRVRGGHFPLDFQIFNPDKFPLPEGRQRAGAQQIVAEPEYLAPLVGDGRPEFFKVDPISRAVTLNRSLGGLTPSITPNELVTGFRIESEVTKLRIFVNAAMTESTNSPSLRVRIDPATPGLERPSVELELPSIPLSPMRRWIEFDYNTEIPPLDAEGERPAPHEPFAPGAYLARIYVVGGVPGRSHFEVSTSDSIDQIPIPGAGCPPYPMLRVEPTSNFHPVIDDINMVGDLQSGVWGMLEADVHDLDLDPIVRYRFVIDYGSGRSQGIHDSASKQIWAPFDAYGIYPVTLEVWDQRCGYAKKRIPVLVRPPCTISRSANPSYPTPVPNDLHLVTELHTLAKFSGDIPEAFNFSVFDPEGCDAPAETRAVQAALFPQGGPGNPQGEGGDAIRAANAYILGTSSLGDRCPIVQVTSEEGNTGVGLDPNGVTCQFSLDNGRIWNVEMDLSNLPPVNPLPEGDSGTYELWARMSDTYDVSTGWSSWKRIRQYDNEGGTPEVVDGSESMNVYDLLPTIKEAAYTTAEFDNDQQTFEFTVSMSPPDTGTGVFQSDEVPIESEEIDDLTGRFPSADNGLASGETTAFFSLEKGIWKGSGASRGYEYVSLGGLHYDRSQLAENEFLGDGAGASLADELCDLLNRSYCEEAVISEDSFNIPLINAPIFVDPLTGGFILTMSFSSYIAGFYQVLAGAGVFLDACPNPGDLAFDAAVWFRALGGVFAGAAIEADWALGIVSTDVGVDAGIVADLPVVMSVSTGGEPLFGFRIDAFVEIWFEVCGLGVLCHKTTERLFDKNILSVGDIGPARDAAVEASGSCSDGGGASLTEDGGGAGVEPVNFNVPSRQLSIASSPDGTRHVAVGRDEDSRLFYLMRQAQDDWQWPPRPIFMPTAQEDEYSGSQMDPEVVFLDNSTVMLAWTQNFSNLDSTLDDVEVEDFSDAEIFNRTARRSEIVYTTGQWSSTPVPGDNLFVWDTATRVTNDTAPDNLRADGKVSLALDPATIGGPFGPGVWATWVRFETPDMIVPSANGDPEVQMNQTSIFARKLFAGSRLTQQRVSENAPGIDIEPSVAIDSNGRPMVVWVNDSIHADLIESNRDREILYSTLQSDDSWSAPDTVFPNTEPLPGLLQPDLALGSNGTGLLVFTALAQDAPETDIGVGSARLLYSAEVTWTDSSISWDDPILIGDICDKPVIAYAPIVKTAGDAYAVMYQEGGAAGSRAGAGNLRAAAFSPNSKAWTQAINLTPDDRVHQGITGAITSTGEMITIHESPILAKRGDDDGAGAGIDAENPFGDLLSHTITCAPDPAIRSCRISDDMAGPGSNLRARVEIANEGFAPFSSEDPVRLTIFKESDGKSEAIETVPLAALEPGETMLVSVEFTMPREPTSFRAALDHVEGEFSFANNERACPLGAQAPVDLTCARRETGDREVVFLTWRNLAHYERIQIYRDDVLVTEVDGRTTSWIDDRPGEISSRSYCLRSTSGVSRSRKSESCSIGEPEGLFIRADANADGTVDISDGVFTLNHLFSGGRAPTCREAANSNGDISVDISDAVFTLNFLFLGGRRPPSPYPACGLPPTPDSVDCEEYSVCAE